MTHTLPALPYAYDALEPHIDARTMEIHHTKHHQTYIDKLNAGLAGTSYAEMSLEELLQSISLLPDELKPVVKNHGGGHYNHSLFRQMMTPIQTKPSDTLHALIKTSFGSVDVFKQAFTDKALANFGSGWTWAIQKYDEIEIMNTPNQENPLMKGEHILLWIDLWEHAYYLQHQQKRADYIANWWNVVNWEWVSKRVKG